MMRYALRHETRYDYGAPVDLGFHMLRLTPPSLEHQRLRAHRLTIEPEPARLDRFVDHFGNQVHYLAIEATHDHFTAIADAEVEIVAVARTEAGPAWEEIRAVMRDDGFPAPPEVAEFLYASPLAAIGHEATAYAAESFAENRPVAEAVRDLTTRINRDFAYVRNRTDISTSVSEVLTYREGVCQDFAHVMIAGLRGLGLPARYVSGYLRTRSAEGDAPRLGADASHAWVSAWCGEELGWIEFDPTNDLVVTDQHIVGAYGRDFSDVTPLHGVILGGGNHLLSVAVSVSPLSDAA